MATTHIISIHVGKGKTAYQSIKERLDYIMNPEKTDGGLLISSHACFPETAADEFMLYRQEYLNTTGRKRGDEVLAYHVRQAFKPGESTAEKGNEIGKALAERLTDKQDAVVVATRIDKQHIQKEFCQGIFCPIIFGFILTNTFEVHPDKSLAFFIESETVLKDAISYSYI